jgi:hypothetical protein
VNSAITIARSRGALDLAVAASVGTAGRSEGFVQEAFEIEKGLVK